ncbi:hypothetical protein CPLU01_06943 [Colletotrichum plurivorum]|uniref:Uncharacterized protein n=1 Tax=Colletotrichum plurivorum TaxID=2175906 RepID=A0A8H6KHF0_9PEZI|nr:hypothetical protein CPLU01_06943 [Colletotrichum plurivorum]
MTAPNERPPTWTNGLPTNHADVGMQERSSHMTGREMFRQTEKGVLREEEAYTRSRVVETGVEEGRHIMPCTIKTRLVDGGPNETLE